MGDVPAPAPRCGRAPGPLLGHMVALQRADRCSAAAAAGGAHLLLEDPGAAAVV